jgi:hypothetical protein
LNGRFGRPDTSNVVTKLQGAVLPDEQVVRGYFPGTNQTGALRLQGNLNGVAALGWLL